MHPHPPPTCGASLRSRFDRGACCMAQLRLVDSFQFTDEQVAYLRKIMPGTEEAFFEWLSTGERPMCCCCYCYCVACCLLFVACC